MAYLQPTKGTDMPVIILNRPRMVFGRLPECDVVIPRREVSRMHAAIIQEGDRWFLEDLGSRNGTFLNGHAVTGRTELREGDEISIGRIVWFTFREGTPSDADSGPTAADTSGPQIVYAIDTQSSSALLQARPEAKLQAILQILNTLGATVNLADTLNRIVDCLPRIFPQMDVGLILLCGRGPDDIRPVASYTRNPRQIARQSFSRTIVRRVIERKESILSTDVSGESSFDLSQSIADLHIRSVMCVPMLSSKGEVLGVFELHTENPRRRFTHEDLEVLVAVARVASVAVENVSLYESLLAKERMERELELAREVQCSLLPDKPPPINGIKVVSHYNPARIVGGDFYDYLRLPDNRFLVVVGDVSGKGMPAALLMVRAITEIRSYGNSTNSIRDILRFTNESLCSRSVADRFLTVVLAAIQPATGVVELVNAAHPPPVYRSPDGKTEFVGVGRNGLPLAVEPTADYEPTVFEMEPGGVLLFYTDGLTDALSPGRKIFGLQSVREAVSAAPSADAEDVCSHVLARLRDHVRDAPTFDDTCIVAVNWSPSS